KTLLRVKQGNKSKSGWNKVKASALRRWLVIRLIAAVQTTRFTGGHDFYPLAKLYKKLYNVFAN
ncbi:MAG: hypothetical protein IJS47_03865, partial [Clostridia bacterium]|nr:hypothetical protein [Clostridia bacterium]